MKKLLSFVLLIYIFFFSIKLNVSAACNDEELKEYAKNFQARLITEEDYLNKIILETNEGYGYLVAFYPYDERVRIEVNDNSNKTINVRYSPSLGTYYFGGNINDSESKIDVYVRANNNSSCSNELLLENKYKIPKFNEYSLSEYCDNNKSDEKCNILYDSSNVSFKDFKEYVEKQEEENNYKNMTTYQKVINFIKNNWYFILIPVLLISIIYIISIRNYKKKVSNR